MRKSLRFYIKTEKISLLSPIFHTKTWESITLLKIVEHWEDDLRGEEESYGEFFEA